MPHLLVLLWVAGLVLGSSVAQAAPAERIREALLELLPAPGEVEVEAVRWLGTAPRETSEVELQVRGVPAGWVHGIAVDAQGQRHAFRAQVRGWMLVWVLEQSVEAGEVVAPVVTQREVALAEVPRDAVFDAELGPEWVARRALRSGTSLRQSDLERPWVIGRHDIVTVFVQRGRVRIEDRAVALGPARQGSTVTVRSLSSERVLTGICRGPGLVEVP